MSTNKSTITDVPVYDQFINGAFAKTNTEYIEVLDPCTEDVIALVPRGKKREADDGVETHQQAEVRKPVAQKFIEDQEADQ